MRGRSYAIDCVIRHHAFGKPPGGRRCRQLRHAVAVFSYGLTISLGKTTPPVEKEGSVIE